MSASRCQALSVNYRATGMRQPSPLPFLQIPMSEYCACTSGAWTGLELKIPCFGASIISLGMQIYFTASMAVLMATYISGPHVTPHFLQLPDFPPPRVITLPFTQSVGCPVSSCLISLFLSCT